MQQEPDIVSLCMKRKKMKFHSAVCRVAVGGKEKSKKQKRKIFRQSNGVGNEKVSIKCKKGAAAEGSGRRHRHCRGENFIGGSRSA